MPAIQRMAKKKKQTKQQRTKQIVEAGKSTRWVKGDPRAVEAGRKGGRRLPKLKDLMDAILGGEDGQAPEDTPMGEIVKALVKEVKNQNLGAQRVAAAKEVLDRAFG